MKIYVTLISLNSIFTPLAVKEIHSGWRQTPSFRSSYGCSFSRLFLIPKFNGFSPHPHSYSFSLRASNIPVWHTMVKSLLNMLKGIFNYGCSEIPVKISLNILWNVFNNTILDVYKILLKVNNKLSFFYFFTFHNPIL